MSAISRDDSVTLRVTFDRALDPAMPLTAALFRVQRADSTELPIAAVIGNVPGVLAAVAAVVRLGDPVTPLVASVSPFLKPLYDAVNDGFASP